MRMDVRTVEPARKELYCSHCRRILKDAVQTENGTRLCEKCFQDISSYAEKKCTECGVDLKEGSENATDPQCQRDRAIRKEILALAVYCKWKDIGCGWTGKLQDHEVHCQGCEYGVAECPNHCGVKLKREDLDAHVLECPEREIDCEHCEEKIRNRRKKEHLLDCPRVLVMCEACGKQMERIKLSAHENNECRLVECYVCNEKVDRSAPGHTDDPVKVFNHILALGRKQRATQQQCDQLTSLLGEYRNSVQGHFEMSLKKLEEDTDKKLSDMVNTTSARLELMMEKSMMEKSMMEKSMMEKAMMEKSMMEKVTQSEPMMLLGTVKSARYDMPGAVEKKLEELEKSNQLLKVRVSELELQLQASLASTHNGAFLWRIPDVARRKRDAFDERITSIYSPPFYTGRNGYKMCIRAYLNGDGIGYKTHLSIFFVLMKGEYDPLLKWPFDHKVSLILVDQNHRKHIVQTFKPTQDSSSFQRPRTDMNVASGCPQFSKLDVLDDSSYVKDDVMYIKCIIDTSRIFHP